MTGMGVKVSNLTSTKPHSQSPENVKQVWQLYDETMGIIVGVKIKAIFRGTKYVLLAHVVGAPLSCDWGIQLLNFRPQPSHLTRTSVSLFLFLLRTTFSTVYWVSAFTIAFCNSLW